MKTITLLGSTGSIGTATLDVVRRRPDLFKVHSLVAGTNTALLAEQIAEFRPSVAVVASSQGLEDLIARLTETNIPKSAWPELSYGPKARVESAVDGSVEFVLSAIVGVAGLEATYEAIRRGKRIGLANKEVLVASGELVMQAAREADSAIIPVDSEHNGAHQC
ncbi:MAG TPA: hypothetical protein VEQ63_08660 [Bryobacteraceae bacterium]|nr:hypothetical protein [Bryobacteraceae bacterium]